jgi:tetratricopeptide (TPR) repeat protein
MWLRRHKEEILGRKIWVPKPYEFRLPNLKPILAFKQANWRHELRAKKRCDALLSTPPERVHERIMKHRPTYVSHPLVAELLRRVRRAVFTDAQHARRMAELALFIAAEMVPGKKHLGTPAMCHEAKARCYAFLGNCHRVLCRWSDAEEYLEKAKNLLWKGVADPHVHAEVQSFRGSFFKEQRQFSAAVQVLKEAASIYQILEEPHEEGLILLNLAQVFRQARQPAKALPVHIRGCELIDEYRDPMIGAAAWNELMRIYTDQGRYEDAYSVLQGVSSVYEQCPADSSVHLVRSWTEGCVLEGLERYGEALEYLERAREGFLSRQRSYDAALVELDMLHILLKQGRHDEVERLGQQVYVSLSAQPLKREAKEALQILAEASVQRHLKEQIIEEAAAAIQTQLRLPKLISPHTATVAGAWDTFPEG